MRVPELQRQFEVQGLESTVMRVEDVDFTADWSHTWVVYPSSEDPGLYYKSFIADVLISLVEAGAQPLPGLSLFHAHHNKALMEMLRQVWIPDDPMAQGTRVYSAYEELRDDPSPPMLPGFLKTASGAGSSGVHHVVDARAARRVARRVMRSYSPYERVYAHLLRLKHPRLVRPSARTRKVLLQQQIAGISGDFKVLRYGHRYFAVRRNNPPGQVTASGAGLLDFAIERYIDVSVLLKFAAEVADRIPSPALSMDIACAGGQCFLLEFQAVYFGPFTMEASQRHWERHGAELFHEVGTDITYEKCFGDAIVGYIRGQDLKERSLE